MCASVSTYDFIIESNLHCQPLFLQLVLTVPPDMQTVFQLRNPPASKPDFQSIEMLHQFWKVSPTTTQNLC